MRDITILLWSLLIIAVWPWFALASANEPCDGYWEAGPPSSVFRGSVGSLAIWEAQAPGLSGRVPVAAGKFAVMGDQVVNNIAAWNGQKWLPIGDGLPLPVVNMVVLPNGQLVAGVTGEGANAGLYRWTGVQWDHFGERALIDNMTLSGDGYIYITGGIPVGQSSIRRGVHRFDGQQWVSLGGDIGSSGSFWYSDIKVDANGDIYVVGFFTSVDGLLARHAAAYIDGQWRALGGGLNAAAYTVEIGPDGAVYAAGYGLDASGGNGRHVVRWDGQAWTNFTTSLVTAEGIYDLTFRADGSLLAMGYMRDPNLIYGSVAQWDGSAWASHPPQAAGTIHASVVDGADLYFADGFDSSNARVWRVTGDVASELSSGGLKTRRASSVAMSGGVLYAATPYDGGVLAGSRPSELQRLSVRYDPAYTIEVVPGSGESVWFAGLFKPGSVPPTMIEWGGSAGELRRFRTNGFPLAMDARAGSPPVVSGRFVNDHGDYFGVGRLIGERIEQIGELPIVPTIGATEVAQDRHGRVYTTVRRSTLGPEQVDVMMWNGSAWSACGAPVLGRVHALTIGSDDTVYIGGQFTSVDGVPCRNVARWDGHRWQPMGAGFTSDVYALEVMGDGRVIAGGALGSSNGTQMGYLARWDGSWKPFPQPVDGPVFDIARVGHADLLIGGEFSRAGDRVSCLIARWRQPFSADIAGSVSGGPDGDFTPADITAFISAFFAQETRADIAGPGGTSEADGVWSVDDIVLFVERFIRGC